MFLNHWKGELFLKVIITIAICVFLGFQYSNYEKSRTINNQVTQNTSNAVQASVRASSSSSEVSRLSEHSKIDRTLRMVAENWKKTDVNNDGLYNCIDAAVLFYQYYPDKNKVCISVNRNQNTGFNHLFNCVFTDGVWKAIEPQAYAMNNSNYLMWASWGNKYDKSLNRDVTADYLKYVKR